MNEKNKHKNCIILVDCNISVCDSNSKKSNFIIPKFSEVIVQEEKCKEMCLCFVENYCFEIPKKYIAEKLSYKFVNDLEYKGTKFSIHETAIFRDRGIFNEIGLYNPIFMFMHIINEIQYLDMLYFNSCSMLPEILNNQELLKKDPNKVFSQKYVFLEDGRLKYEKPDLYFEYIFLNENIIYRMMSIFNNLIFIVYLISNEKQILSENKVCNVDVGNVCRDRSKNFYIHEYIKIVKGDYEYMADATKFLSMLNNLYNSMKHSINRTYSASILITDEPTVYSLDTPRKSVDIDQIKKAHVHQLKELMKGFNYNFFRIIDNLKLYINNNTDNG